jgi:hypothetical protein
LIERIESFNPKILERHIARRTKVRNCRTPSQQSIAAAKRHWHEHTLALRPTLIDIAHSARDIWKVEQLLPESKKVRVRLGRIELRSQAQESSSRHFTPVRDTCA